MSKPHILVVGSSNTDMTIKMDRIPRPGESIIGGQFTTAAGGKGANQAVAASRAGGRVTFVGRAGNDVFGEQAIAGLARDGINVDYVVRDSDSPSGVALIFVGKNGENSIGVATGANEKLTPNDVLNAKGVFEGASVLIMQLETPLDALQTAAELAVQAGARVILNPAPARELPDRLLKCVSILTPNETETELLTGIKVDKASAMQEAALNLIARGVETVIITLGARGAFVANGGAGQLVAGFRAEAVDTTAAGDTFNGALAVALAEGQALGQAVRFANAAAAISVTRAGAQPSAPRREEIESFLAMQ
jgi:ribokinase